ncbi:MAG TPA: hypothetical protein PLK77_00865 [Pyrinomonadaceae bacterium]|nr:hypothetical protein [Pyrinomonadaceae bacterium]
MNKDAIVVLHGFFQLPNLEKKKVVDAINNYFDSTEREPIRAEYDDAFKQLSVDDPAFECKCCGRN